jgi:hypothetical protein
MVQGMEFMGWVGIQVAEFRVSNFGSGLRVDGLSFQGG